MLGTTLRDLLLGPPGALSASQARAVRPVAILSATCLCAALAGCGLAVIGGKAATALSLAILGLLCGVASWIARRGHAVAASRLLFVAAAVCTTALVLTGRTVGFGATAVMLYPVLVIAIGLIFDRRDWVLAMGLVLALLGLVLVATLSGRLTGSPPPARALADFGYAVLIVAVSGVASRLLADGMMRSARRNRLSQEALALANKELGAQASQRETLLQQLAARNSELQRFTETVSHDLAAPLDAIGASTASLERNALHGDRGQLQTDFERTGQALQEMSGLLAELYELSRAGQPNAGAPATAAREAD